MKKITFLLLAFMVYLGYSQTASNYCDTEVTHLGIPAEVNSTMNLTIENTGANTLKITAAASDINFLTVVGTPIAGGAASQSVMDTSVAGEVSIVLTYTTPPTGDAVLQYLQWRLDSTGGATWQLNDVTTPFLGVCVPVDPTTDASLSDLQIDGMTISGFSSSQLTYDYKVAQGTVVVPQITTATTTQVGASRTISQASGIPGSATVDVTASDGTTMATYTVNISEEGPAVAAPTPPNRPAADVVSIFSDSYAPISPINLDAGWCGANSVESIMVEGDAVLAYKDKPCQGINFDMDLQDVTGFTHIHVDLYIEPGTDIVGKVFNMKVVPTSGAESGFNVDLNAQEPKPVPGTWYSYDATISFAGPTVDIKEFGVTSNLNNVVWYDNLYLHKNTTLVTDEFNQTSFKVFPNPTQDSWNIKTQSRNIQSIKVYDVLGKNVMILAPNKAEATIDGSSLVKGMYFAKIETESGSSSIKLIKQ